MRTDWHSAAGMAIVGILDWRTGGIARADTWPIVDRRAAHRHRRPGLRVSGHAERRGARRVAADGSRSASMLHAVTHPCPEDLAILLVHNDTDKYLLMSNAGGCRPLQGTTIRFDPGCSRAAGLRAVLAAARRLHRDRGRRTTAPLPVFPSPAPPGLYTFGLPPATTNINGKWKPLRHGHRRPAIAASSRAGRCSTDTELAVPRHVFERRDSRRRRYRPRRRRDLSDHVRSDDRVGGRARLARRLCAFT